MTGKEMRELIGTGTCPQCKGALSNRTKVNVDPVGDMTLGECDPCNIKWVGLNDAFDPRVMAEQKWTPRALVTN